MSITYAKIWQPDTLRLDSTRELIHCCVILRRFVLIPWRRGVDKCEARGVAALWYTLRNPWCIYMFLCV